MDCQWSFNLLFNFFILSLVRFTVKKSFILLCRNKQIYTQIFLLKIEIESAN